MLPTFAELAGVDCPKTDGISMAPTLLGKGEQRKHEHLFWEFYEGGGRPYTPFQLRTWQHVVLR